MQTYLEHIVSEIQVSVKYLVFYDSYRYKRVTPLTRFFELKTLKRDH